jgi:hypothetical protein
MYMLKDEPDPPVLLEVLERGAVRAFLRLRRFSCLKEPGLVKSMVAVVDKLIARAND